MMTTTPKPDNQKIPPAEVNRLIAGSVILLFTYGVLFSVGLFKPLYLIVSFLIISIAVGIALNLKNLKLAWMRMLAPEIGLVLVVVNTVIGLVKLIVFMISGFDSKTIVKKIKWIKFPEAAKPKRAFMWTRYDILFFFIGLGFFFYVLTIGSDFTTAFPPASVFLDGLIVGILSVFIIYALIEGINVDSNGSKTT